jgi:hypothetical protein
MDRNLWLSSFNLEPDSSNAEEIAFDVSKLEFKNFLKASMLSLLSILKIGKLCVCF